MLPSMTFAKVEVPSIFGDNMILQRELLVPIWGTASPGEKVLVSFDNQTVETTADKQGKWMVKLKPLKTSRTERKLTIKGSNTITFEGVLVGEVWLCSGQSNMADSFNPQKKRRIEPEYFKMDLSRFRVSNTAVCFSCVFLFWDRALQRTEYSHWVDSSVQFWHAYPGLDA
jgi:hypothetical protein